MAVARLRDGVRAYPDRASPPCAWSGPPVAGRRGGSPCAALAGAALALGACRADRPRATPTLTVSVPYSFETADPHELDRMSAFGVLSQVYEPVVSTDAAMALTPLLATHWVNPDPLTWVLHLRADVRFRSGKPLRAADVVHSIERLLGDRSLQVSGYVSDVESVAARDDLTVSIRTRWPALTLLHKLRFVLIVPAAGARPAGDGTGPYAIASVEPGKLVVLRRNEAYWGPRPDVERVILRLGRNGPEALRDFASGDSDLVQGQAHSWPAGVGRGEGARVFRVESLFVKYLGFGFGRVDAVPFGQPSPFRPQAVREAVALAIDRGRIASALEVIPASQPVPRAVAGFDPGLSSPAHDPARSRELLREAGVAPAGEVELVAPRSLSEAARLIAEDLGKVGLRLRVTEVPDPELSAVVRGRGATLFLSQFACLTGDASEVLEKGFHSPDPARHFGTLNYAGFVDAGLDREIEAALEEAAVTGRQRRVQQLVREVTQRRIWIPLYFEQVVYAVRAPFSWRPRADNLVLASEVSID